MPPASPALAPAPGAYVAYFVARQPILDRHQKLFGYELLFRDGLEATMARVTDAEKATLSVASSGFIRSSKGASGARMFINFTEKLILERVPLALPPQATVIEIMETVRPTPEVLEAILELKNEGYTLAVDDYVGQEQCDPFLRLVDIVKVDILGRSSAEVRAFLKKLQPYHCTLLAEKVENEASFRMARLLGFELFQGFFFARPENLAERKLTSHEASRFRIMQELEKTGVDIDLLTRAIQADVSISYRLLRYLNSAAFSFYHEVKSIRQAILLLGLRQTRNWLRLVILADLIPQGVNSELPLLSLERARFLELAAEASPADAPSPESMFLLGLFSLLEPMLAMPMHDIVPHLPLSEEFADALVGKKNRVADWLDLTRALESGDWEWADQLAASLGLRPKAVAAAHVEAMEWAAHYLGGLL